MQGLRFHHGRGAMLLDVAAYGFAVGTMAIWLLMAPVDRRAPLAAWALLGLGGWTWVEYALHRFVLHGVRPFSTWHAEHHRHPTALICTPTLMSASLIALLVFLPALLLTDLWDAGAVTMGLTTGYLAYTVTHHAIHHGHLRGPWLNQRRAWHALHHHMGRPGCYGVTTSFWDRALGSVTRPRPRPRRSVRHAPAPARPGSAP